MIKTISGEVVSGRKKMSLFLMAAEVPKGSSRSSPGRSQDTKKKTLRDRNICSGEVKLKTS